MTMKDLCSSPSLLDHRDSRLGDYRDVQVEGQLDHRGGAEHP